MLLALTPSTRECTKCGAEISVRFEEGDYACAIYHGLVDSGYCPLFVDGKTREQQKAQGLNGGPPLA